MKKLFLIGAMVLSFGMMSTAFAATLDMDTTSGTMDVTYGVESGYTVTIPGDLALTDATAKTANVSASNVMIEAGEILKVTISSTNYANNNWNLVAEGAAANKLPYTIKADGVSVANGGTILSVADGIGSDESVLSFQLVDLPTRAGQYKDTLTFTVSVE